MFISNEIAHLDATSLGELVRKKEVKVIELIDDTIERIEKLNPALNAVITSMYDFARDAAKSSIPDGPFTGVPFLIKDLLTPIRGVPMSNGSKVLMNFVPDHDSELVRRYKRAGLIIVGKTNTSEFGLLPTTEPKAFGPTRNPWNTTCSPGGSSGGSAVAVASRMVPMAHGNDGGGSLRIPASCCGVFALKPTRARNSWSPDLGDLAGGMACAHALTLSVRDSAALLDATAGYVMGDPYWAPPITRPFIKEVGADPGVLRIAFSSNLSVSGYSAHGDCTRAVNDAALLCESLGHRVEEMSPVINESSFPDAIKVKWSACAASSVKILVKTMGLSQEHFEELTWKLYELGMSYDAADYLLAEQTIQRASRDIASFFEKYDLWLTPTLGLPPPPLGSFDATPNNPLHGFELTTEVGHFTGLCNLTGQPAMSVPLYWNTNAIPIGAHFVGRFGDEATLFRLAAQLESARPWNIKRPPVCA